MNSLVAAGAITLIALYCAIGIFFLYTSVRDDIRAEKQRKKDVF